MYTQISPEEAKDLQNKGNLIIDVRETNEYAAGHIAGAKNAPLSALEESIALVSPDKNAPILIYCQSGRRSKIASSALVELGYTAVYEFGGIIDWPYEIVQ